MASYFESILGDPESFHCAPYDEAFRLSNDQIERLHLEGARRRFNELRPKISVLNKLAREQGVEQIERIDDIAPLLFPHTVYKSYPMSYLENNRFDKLTKWLSGLTTTDLGGVDAGSIQSIDDWLDLLDAQTPLMVQHTSGTTGKLSFVPRTKVQRRQNVVLSAMSMRDWRGRNSGPFLLEQRYPIIAPGYRYGAAAMQRGNGLQVEMFAGGEDNALFLYPNARFSADVASLAGRLKAAEAKGEAGLLNVPPVLLQRREQLLALERSRNDDLRHFYEQALSRFGGKDVYIAAMWAVLFDWADGGLQRGLKGVFGPNSVLITGGGKKGTVMPDDWRERSTEFLGFSKNIFEFYGTSEMMGISMMCEEGHYHIPPVIVPFLLDPATGAPLPRKDGTTGRFAGLDLMPNNYWCGLVTGDEITLSGWQKPCACGRTGPHVIPPVRRYGENEGGDDRVVCAGAPEAHDRALDFLAQLSSM